jgi:hypothetical protein
MRIYLASPYSHTDHAVRLLRFNHACAAAAKIMGRGHQVFSPIAHSHSVALYMEPYMEPDRVLDFNFWMDQDLGYIQHWAEAVIVLMLNGWQNSRGINREIDEAKRQGVPVFYYGRLDTITEGSWLVAGAE